MKNILETLDIPKHLYELYCFDQYFNWCQKQAKNDTALQLIINDKKIERWYQNQYRKLEIEFFEIIAQYENKNQISRNDLLHVYGSCTGKIMYLYPSALLPKTNKIKKNCIALYTSFNIN